MLILHSANMKPDVIQIDLFFSLQFPSFHFFSSLDVQLKTNKKINKKRLTRKKELLLSYFCSLFNFFIITLSFSSSSWFFFLFFFPFLPADLSFTAKTINKKTFSKQKENVFCKHLDFFFFSFSFQKYIF